MSLLPVCSLRILRYLNESPFGGRFSLPILEAKKNGEARMESRTRPISWMSVSLLLLIAILAISAPRLHSQSARKPWNRPSSVIALSTLERRSGQALGGFFSWYCPSQEVRALAVAGDTLWIATEGGLFAMSLSLDAIEQVSGPISPSIRDIAIDESGALWVLCDRSLSLRSRGRWRHFLSESSPFFQRLRCIAPGDGRMWIGSYGGGIGYVEGELLNIFSRPDSIVDRRILDIVELSRTTLYAGTASGLAVADTGGWRSLRYGTRLPIGAVRALEFDEEGDLFCSIAGRGAAIYSFGRVRTFGDGLPMENIAAFSIEPNTRDIWAAGDGGVFVFNDTEWIERRIASNGARRPRFLSMEHDLEGNCYLGTDEGSVIVLSGANERKVSLPANFATGRVPRIRSQKGSIWCIAGKAVMSGRNSFSNIAYIPAPYAGEATDFLRLESGEIWVTTRFGALRFQGGKWETFDRRKGLPTENFKRIACDAQGILWFASPSSGVFSYNGGEWRRYTSIEGLPSDSVEDLVVDSSGVPWVVTSNGGLAKFVKGQWQRMHLPLSAGSDTPAKQTPDTAAVYDPAIKFLRDSFRGYNVSGISERWCLGLDENGNCMIGCGVGVYKMSSSGWVLFELPERLRGVECTAVLGVPAGEIWVCTAGSGLFVYRNGSWLRAISSTGLSDDFLCSICRDEGGSIWIGTQSGGITRYSPMLHR